MIDSTDDRLRHLISHACKYLRIIAIVGPDVFSRYMKAIFKNFYTFKIMCTKCGL